MQTVTFAKPYRHRLDALREAVYPVGKMKVSNEVADAARKAGKLKEEKDAGGSHSTERTSSDNHTQE